MSVANVAALIAQKTAELVALRAAKLTFWENGGVTEYSIEDRTVRYTSYEKMCNAEDRLCSDIEALQARGGGNLVKFNAFC